MILSSLEVDLSKSRDSESRSAIVLLLGRRLSDLIVGFCIEEH